MHVSPELPRAKSKMCFVNIARHRSVLQCSFNEQSLAFSYLATSSGFVLGLSAHECEVF